jgi:leucyl aminopeptidase
MANHDATRTRKLLLHREEVRKLLSKTQIKGHTLIPTRLYFRNGRVKCELAVAKGKQDWDKRETDTAVRFCKPRAIHSLAIEFCEATLPPGPCARAIIEGVHIGDFDPDIYRSDRKDQSVQTVILAGTKREDAEETAAIQRGFDEGNIIGTSQNFARSLVNEPGNKLTPTILGQRASAMCGEFGLKCEVHSTAKLEELKMGAFLAVAQGSAEPPALIVMTYEPAKPSTKDVLALVGKGITFDTGGISIKPADGMEKMKYDMAGGRRHDRRHARHRPAQAQRKSHWHRLLRRKTCPTARPTSPATWSLQHPARPSKSSTPTPKAAWCSPTAWYAQQLGATHLIDAATLTGACVVALGIINAGLFSNDDATCAKFEAGLALSGEKFWRLPCTDDYREQIKSGIADIMNTGGSRWGGAITAAMFLKEFAAKTRPGCTSTSPAAPGWKKPNPGSPKAPPASLCAPSWSGCAATSHLHECSGAPSFAYFLRRVGNLHHLRRLNPQPTQCAHHLPLRHRRRCQQQFLPLCVLLRQNMVPVVKNIELLRQLKCILGQMCRFG